MVDKLIEIALAEVGYLEKKNKDNLDSKTANAGDKNYTKYARDMTRYNAGIYVNGYAWCDTFVDWCFTQAFGAEQAEKMLFGWSAYTPTSSGYFKQKGQWHTKNPKKGDVIYFKNASPPLNNFQLLAISRFQFNSNAHDTYHSPSTISVTRLVNLGTNLEVVSDLKP